MWLFEHVGEGKIFTKADLRAAFPDIEQIDRRMRDLRSAGWVIHTNRQDPSLRPRELRLVSIGDQIWATSRTGPTQRRITPAERRAAMRRCDYRCVRCGAGAGEPFADERAASAVLSVRSGGDPSSGGPSEVAVLCQRCFGSATDADLLSESLSLVDELDEANRIAVLAWLAAGRREIRPAERLWQRVVRLSPDARETVRAILASRADAASSTTADVTREADPAD